MRGFTVMVYGVSIASTWSLSIQPSRPSATLRQLRGTTISATPVRQVVSILSRSHSATTTSTCLRARKTADEPIVDDERTEAQDSTPSPPDDTLTESTLVRGLTHGSVVQPLSLLLISQFLLFVGVGAVIPSIPLYGKEIGLSSSMNGVVISAPAVALLLLAKAGGNVADVARKPAMLLGMAVIAASDLGTALAGGIGTLVVARLGLGAGRCLSEAGERGMLADLAGQVPELRGRALAAQQTAVALGIAIGAPLGGIVVEEYGPRAAFLCVSAAALVTMVLYLFLPETVNRLSRKDPVGVISDSTALLDTEILDRSEAANETRQTISRGDWSRLLSKREWRGLALCQCGASFGFAAKIASIPIIASQVLPGGAAGAGALLSAAGLSGIVGAPVGGWLTDQTSSKSTAILSGVVSAAGLILVPVALGLPMSDENDVIFGITGRAAAFSAVVIAWSLGASAQGPAMTALAQELAPQGAEATAMALPRATGDGTYIVAPFLLGLVTDSILSMPGAECAFAGFATLLGVTALGLLGPKSLDQD